MTAVFRCLFLFLIAAILSPGNAQAAGPRVLPAGEQPADSRLGELNHLRGHFPFAVPNSARAWNERAEEVRRRVLVATGLWPMPERTPLNAVIHGRVERDGFTVEKVYFESIPNHFVTGLLFRPTGQAAPGPGVLCPHGHGGRLQDYVAKSGEEAFRQMLADGAERFERSGRFPKLARCAQLARMGCTTFIFDMIGYADSVQIPREIAHGFKKQRPELDSPQRWGFFSTQAELRLQSIMGLQTWNSIRALDFLCELPEVDAGRIGVTGGSGGGTQTILLCAIDPRPVVGFPNGMVSTSMQGGCTCENCTLLRVGTGNVELAALFAPKPQGMTAANDWTVDMLSDGFPELRRVYKMLGAPDHVMCRDLRHFPHNYNYVTRATMYDWFNEHLELGLEEPIVEEDWEPLTPGEYTVWNDEHPKPEAGEDYEPALLKSMAEESDRQMAALRPTDADSLCEYRRIVGGAWATIIRRGLPSADEVEVVDGQGQPHVGYLQITALARNTTEGEEVPVVALLRKLPEWNGNAVLWVDGRGKAGLFTSDGAPRAEIIALLDHGFAVVGADLFMQGEFLAEGERGDANRVVDNGREAAAYTFGYNDTLFAQRVHDLLTLTAFLAGQEKVEGIHLVGAHGGGPWVAAAAARAGEAVTSMAIDTEGFRFLQLTSYRDANFAPGAVKYGDLPGLLALLAGRPLLLLGEDGLVPSLVRDAYAATAAESEVTSVMAGGEAREIVNWLIGRHSAK